MEQKLIDKMLNPYADLTPQIWKYDFRTMEFTAKNEYGMFKIESNMALSYGEFMIYITLPNGEIIKKKVSGELISAKLTFTDMIRNKYKDKFGGKRLWMQS